MMKIPPHNLEAEKGILEAILFDPDSLLKASDIIEPQDFYREAHRKIYDACLDLYQLGENINYISLCERLKTKGEIEAVGGRSYISQLASNGFTSTIVNHHARIVREKALLRKTQRFAYEIIRKVEEDSEDLKDLFAGIEKGIIQLSESLRGKKSPLLPDILRELNQRWEKKEDELYIPLDHKLNSAIPGFFPKHLWFIGGYTSVGKSTLLAQLIVDACHEGAKVLIFSLEDSREDKLIKLIANLSDVSQRRLVCNDFENFKDRVQRAIDTLKTWDVIIYDDVYTLDELRLKTKKHKMQNGINIVCIDFIQNLQGPGSIYERMSEAATKLQAMAKELEVTVIVLSQVSNEAMKEGTEIIGLKGAGELAASADIILWLRRIKEQEKHLDCEIRKNRPFGTIGKEALAFSEYWTRIEKRE